MRKQRKIIIITVAVLLAIFAVALLLVYIVTKTRENMKYAREDYGLKEDEVMIILENELSDLKALRRGNTVYVPYSIVEEKLNDGFYDDEDENDEQI